MAIMGQQCDNMVSVILCRGTVTAPVICMFDFNGLMTCGIAEVYPIAIIFFWSTTGEKKHIQKQHVFGIFWLYPTTNPNSCSESPTHSLAGPSLETIPKTRSCVVNGPLSGGGRLGSQ